VTIGPARAAALLAAAVLLTHLPLLSAAYVQDDHVAVEDNDVVAHGDLATIFGAGYWDATRGGDRSLYRPLTVASYAAERAVAGTARPAVSHAVNLVLHAAVCWLVFLVAVSCGIEAGPALLAALLFAVTPAKSEAVANVVGRAELLAALFTLAGVRLAMNEGSRASAWAAGACAAAACASKETGFAALPLIALAAWGSRKVVDRLGMIAPSVLAVVVVVIARTQALQAFFPRQAVPVIDNPLVREPGLSRLATALALIPRYARIVLFPFGLANDYSGASIPIEGSLAAWRPMLGLLILAGLAWIATRGRVRALFVAIALLPYLLVSNLVIPAGSIFAERFLYLPAAGLGLLAAWAMGRRSRRAALLLVVVLGAAMFARAADWKDDATIFAATARHNPKSPRAWLWLSRTDEAIASWPEFAAPWHDQGVELAKRGELPEAERALREAVRLEPERAASHRDLALVLHRTGEVEAAIREVRKAILLDPDDSRALAELGHLRFETHRFEEAAAAYLRAIALGRTDLAPRLDAARAAARSAP